ncbi:alanine racemase, partial [Paenibacillus sp. 1001270B_150601_E10]|uniref:alanine racemase n=1 Tax=Paenibacillus sp. 1001270B_150601_E10 TaxID=2787079 RepID=UPI001E5BDF7D
MVASSPFIMTKAVSVVKANSYGAVDSFKMIAAMMVIAIHTGPLASYNAYADFLLTGVLARLAVPIFLVAAGFFLFQKLTGEAQHDRSIIRQYTLRILKLYNIAIIIYLPVNLYTGYFSTDFSAVGFMLDLLVNGTLYHLWYFPALIVGVYMTYFLYRQMSFPYLFVVTGALYLIGLMGDSYYGLTEQHMSLHSMYHWWFQWFDYTRSGVFFAPLFLAIGAWAAAYPKRFISAKMAMFRLVLSLLLLITEGAVLKAQELPRHDSMYLFLVPAVYELFYLLISRNRNARPYLRKMSTWIYILHPLAIIIVRGLAKFTGLSPFMVANSLIHFVLVTIVSIAAAAVVGQWKPIKQPKRSGRYRAWAEINLSHFKHNVNELKRRLPDDCRIMAVVKANAYGHGSVPVAKCLQSIGVNAYAVAEIGEGIALRKAGIRGEILILGYTSPWQFEDLSRYDLTQTVIHAEYALALNQYGKKMKVHVKIDTGMGRLGESADQVERILSMYRQPHLLVTGTYSHFSVPDSERIEDITFTEGQIRCFYHLVGVIKANGFDPGRLHLQSSYGILYYPQLNCDLARPGISLYGAIDIAKIKDESLAALLPVLSLKARVTMVKRVPAGTYIGYGRHFKTTQDSLIATVSI